MPPATGASSASTTTAVNGGVVTTANSYCIALHIYPSSKPDELSLVPGEVIQVLKKADDGWWYGRKVQPPEERTGWFPSNFNYEPDNIDIKKQGISYARVDFEYKAQEEDELTLNIGDIITIINTEEDDGWHRGILNGRVGLFPANFVKVMTKAELDRDKRSVKKVASGVAPSERRASLVPSKFQELQKQEAAAAAAEKNSSKEPIICRAVVTFDYAAQQPDELTLSKGMKIDVIAKDDEGWWTGIDSTGQRGVFPYNFVSELARDDNPPEKGSASPKTSQKSGKQSSSDSSKPKSATSGSSPAAESRTQPPVIKAPKPSAGKVSDAIQAMSGKPVMKMNMPGMSRDPSQTSQRSDGSGNNEPSAKKKNYGAQDSNSAASPLTHVTKHRVSLTGRRPPSHYGADRHRGDPNLDIDSESEDNDHLRAGTYESQASSLADDAAAATAATSAAYGQSQLHGVSPESLSPLTPMSPPTAQFSKPSGDRPNDASMEVAQLRSELQQWMQEERKSRESMAAELAAIRKAMDRLLQSRR